ncbi:hypothetical protein DV515_00018050 [Chloebia gouldiae]|uniref:Uncharacterized protein n=1 Tax=Chloebia gouldiae TaxID=44316 RepID=A0A3L8Q8K6_CHLGU|nr:hypothetical protein DV515_00018050 [Chloebia gouldiae]
MVFSVNVGLSELPNRAAARPEDRTYALFLGDTVLVDELAPPHLLANVVSPCPHSPTANSIQPRPFAQPMGCGSTHSPSQSGLAPPPFPANANGIHPRLIQWDPSPCPSQPMGCGPTP